MKDLLSKEHYSSKIHASLMKCSGYPPFYRHPLHGITWPQILQEHLHPLFHDFSKMSAPFHVDGNRCIFRNFYKIKTVADTFMSMNTLSYMIKYLPVFLWIVKLEYVEAIFGKMTLARN